VAGALIIGGESRALGISRSLGRRGIPVWVIEESDYLLARHSRYVGRRFPWPEGEDESAQASYVSGLAAEHGLEGWTLFATADETAALVARRHEELARSFRLTTPPWERTRLAYDKSLTYRLAREAGLAAPRTHQPGDAEELAALELEFPCILKPSAKPDLNRFTHDKAWPAATREELLERYREACELVSPREILVQELIPGGGEAQLSFGAACADGRPVGSIVANRRRQYPVDFGHSSSFVETVEDAEVERAGRAMLAAIGYDGLVEVEFKRDPRDGELKVLDVNPRLWTWFTLGRRAGVDFPYLGHLIAQGERPAEARSRPGARWARMGTDVLAAAAEIRRGRLSPLAYLRSLRPPLQLAVLELDDPRPFAAALPSLLSRLLRRAPRLLGGRLRFRSGGGRARG
jgi:D-aspartate ligase